MIWGGKNGSLFYSDLHMYNTLTNIWESVEVKSEIKPTAVEGACMETYNDNLYIFGGKNEFRSNNLIWKFDLGTHEYTLLSRESYKIVDPVSYATCYAIENNLYIMLGLKDNTDATKIIHIFDLEIHRWDISDVRILS